MEENKTRKRTKWRKDRIYMPEVKKILPPEMLELPLSVRELKFIASYVTRGMDEVKAYLMAGYCSGKNKSDEAQAKSILNRPRVQQALKFFIDSALSPYKDRLEYMLVDTLYRRAFYEIGLFYDEDGRAYPLDEIPREAQKIIDGVETKTIGTGANQRVITKYQLASRQEAMKCLMEFLDRYIGEGTAEDSNFTADKREQTRQIFQQAAGGNFNSDLFKKYNLENDSMYKKVFEKGEKD